MVVNSFFKPIKFMKRKTSGTFVNANTSISVIKMISGGNLLDKQRLNLGIFAYDSRRNRS